MLEKHLGKYQTLRPRTPVAGMIAGLPVFLRTCVRELQTARQWKLKGRKLSEGQLDAPAKVWEPQQGKGGKGGTAMQKWRIVRLGFGTARQETVLE